MKKNIDSESQRCFFCGCPELIPLYSELFHPLKGDHGPFDFYACSRCGSAVTWPKPSRVSLNKLYEYFDSGLPEELRENRNAENLAPWFNQCIESALSINGCDRSLPFTWLDVGAGAGEATDLMSKRYPLSSGIAVDLHNRPEALPKRQNISWLCCDINERQFSNSLDVRADIVLAISLWEHVIDPYSFASNLLSLVRPGGTVYLVCPDWGSLMRKLMRRRWPFFIPGEHINMPSILGARYCLERALAESHWQGGTVTSRSVGLPYSLRYYLNYLGFRSLSRMLSPKLAIPFPAGVVEATVTVDG